MDKIETIIIENYGESKKSFTERMKRIYFSSERVFPGRIIEWNILKGYAEFVVNNNIHAY